MVRFRIPLPSLCRRAFSPVLSVLSSSEAQSSIRYTSNEQASGSNNKTQMKFNNTTLLFNVLTFVIAFYLGHTILLLYCKRDVIFLFSMKVFRQKKEADLKKHQE